MGVFIRADDTHTLGIAAVAADLVQRDADDDSVIGDDHAVFVAVDCLETYKAAGLFGDIHCLDALGAAAGHTVFLQVGLLAVAVCGNRKNLASFLGGCHTDDIAAVGVYTLDAHCAASGRTDRIFFKAHCLAVGYRKDDVCAAAGRFDEGKLIIFTQGDGNLSVCPDVLKLIDDDAFDKTFLCRKEESLGGVLLAVGNDGADLFLFLKTEKIDDRNSLGRAAVFGNIEASQTEDASL